MNIISIYLRVKSDTICLNFYKLHPILGNGSGLIYHGQDCLATELVWIEIFHSDHFAHRHQFQISQIDVVNCPLLAVCLTSVNRYIIMYFYVLRSVAPVALYTFSHFQTILRCYQIYHSSHSFCQTLLSCRKHRDKSTMSG